MQRMRRQWTLYGLLCGAALGSAQAAGTLTLAQIRQLGYVERLECRAGLTICVGVTPLAPNSLASALGLLLPDRAQDGTDTAGRGWRIQQQPLAGVWTVMIEPLGRFLTAAERRAFPDSSALVAAPARPAPSAGSSGAQTRRTDPAEGRGEAPAPIPAPVRGQPGRTGAGLPAEQTPVCTVVIDVRGLGHLQPDMTSLQHLLFVLTISGHDDHLRPSLGVDLQVAVRRYGNAQHLRGADHSANAFSVTFSRSLPML